MDKTKFRPIGVENDKADNSVIAPVESGTTASRAYAAGAHFIRDSAFCTAKTAIAQGETFRLNTNYTAGNIALAIPEIKALNPFNYITINSGITINSAGIAQIAEHIAIINIDIRATLNKGETVIGQSKNTIKMGTYLAGRSSTASGTYPATGVILAPNGPIRIHTIDNSVSGVLNGIIVI